MLPPEYKWRYRLLYIIHTMWKYHLASNVNDVKSNAGTRRLTIILATQTQSLVLSDSALFTMLNWNLNTKRLEKSTLLQHRHECYHIAVQLAKS
jgi:hypothetical protein